jgi:hypothetical protein
MGWDSNSACSYSPSWIPRNRSTGTDKHALIDAAGAQDVYAPVVKRIGVGVRRLAKAARIDGALAGPPTSLAGGPAVTAAGDARLTSRWLITAARRYQPIEHFAPIAVQ